MAGTSSPSLPTRPPRRRYHLKPLPMAADHSDRGTTAAGSPSSTCSSSAGDPRRPNPPSLRRRLPGCRKQAVRRSSPRSPLLKGLLRIFRGSREPVRRLIYASDLKVGRAATGHGVDPPAAPAAGRPPLRSSPSCCSVRLVTFHGL